MHRRVIARTMALNSDTPLARMAEVLNDMPELATMSRKLTPKILKKLGYKDPLVKAVVKVVGGSGNGADVSNLTSQMTPQKMRGELEVLHHKLVNHKDRILTTEEITGTQLDQLEKIEKIDAKIRDQIQTLMAAESAPLLPQAIICMCMRKLGVLEEAIKIIKDVA